MSEVYKAVYTETYFHWFQKTLAANSSPEMKVKGEVKRHRFLLL